MLFTKLTAAQKRIHFRDQLQSGKLLRFPGAHAPLVARIIEEQSFDGVYISGSAIAADLALPDIGLTTLTEVAERGRQISRVTDLPTLIDADTGFGEAVNVARTIQELEAAGLAGCHIEDQVLPKRCGHLDNKQIITQNEMLQKIGAALNARRDENFLIMARTDAKNVDGLDAAITRARAYVEAGADAIFAEALETKDEFSAFRDAINAPILANMTEFGKTPLLTTDELSALGYNIVIYPVTSLRLAMKTIEDAFAELKQHGTQTHLVDKMQTRARLYEILRYSEYAEFDSTIFDFEL